MDKDQQRIEIAQACGWTKILTPNQTGHWMTGVLPHGLDREVVPNYLRSLDAMHAATKTLSEEQLCVFADHLNVFFGGFSHTKIHATAAQRAEAFLRTLGKWKDSELSSRNPKCL